MKQQTLFPSEPPAAPFPGQPPVWLKRLAIIRSEDTAETPIRDIGFRLGLNVVMVAEDGTAFGHNLGKTLMVRLIRFCLGDAQYADANMRGRIRDVLPDAWVLGVIRVQGTDWSIARSLGHLRRGWCLRGDDWRQVFRDAAARRPYAEFQEELERLVPAEFGQVHLDRLDRCPAWPDLLGWLARDQACRYRHHNEWRDAGADSGVAALSLGNANLITRLTTGLFDAEENRHTQQLELLRADTRTCEAETARFRVAAELMRANLVAVVPSAEEMPDGPLFADAIRTQVGQRRESQERLLDDPDNRRGLEQAEQDLVASRTVADRTAGRLEELDRRRNLVAGQIEAASRSPSADRALLSCGLAGCLHMTAQADALPDPMREQRIRDYEGEARGLDQEIAAARSALDQQERAARDAMTRHDEARTGYQRVTSGIRQAIARCDSAAEELARYEALQARLTAAEDRLRTNRDREGEIERQREARAETRGRAMAELNAVFAEVTAALLRRASGELVLNLRDGLAPRTDASTGEAFGTAGKVIGFDLACLLAAMLGLGRHPRFLVHDSPREADLHPAIYENLFRFARTLEARFQGQAPAFQYVLTTTTPPPTELAGQPYVRETLHAASPQGRLLRVEF